MNLKMFSFPNILNFWFKLGFCIVALTLVGHIAQAQAPSGYIYCAAENGSFTLPAKSHVAYGANGKYKYLFNQTGKITFNTTTFGSDPIFGVYKSGYYKIADGKESTSTLVSVMERLIAHLNGTTVLTANKILLLTDTIQQNIFLLGDGSNVVKTAFELSNKYETVKGPIFINKETKGGFTNIFGTADGLELTKAVFLVQQGILDYIYTPKNTKKYLNLMSGNKFLTSNFFPGVCAPPIDPKAAYKAKINASMPKEYGKRTAWSSTPARRPTGYYLAPGSIGTVRVPVNLVNKGFKILVGAHSFDRTGSNPVRRFFRVNNTYPITDTITQIANPFGGGIYIITPYEAAEGIAEIQLSNVVPAPFFSFKNFDKTTLQQWQKVQRKNPAPWADFESDKYMMQVPTSWIYNYDDPVTLMQDWDKRMDVVSKMLGHPLVRNNTILYLQIDTDIMFGGYGIGNPQINNTYSPYDTENGNKDHWFLKPGSGFWETEFHEMGHAQLFSNFPGEGEAMVNFLAVGVYNRLYKIGIDTAFGKSFDNKPNVSRDQAALNWMVTPNFRAGKPQDISNTTKDEVRYQFRGYGKYVEMAALFGWSAIDSFYRKENIDFIKNVPTDSLGEVDSRIFRFSQTCGIDVRPLIHFWGVHPVNNKKLQAKLDTEKLKPSKLICDRLKHYQSIIPQDNAAFVAHGTAFLGYGTPWSGDPDYGAGWYNVWLPQYNQTHGIAGTKAMQNIIDLYFPNGCPTNAQIPVISVNNPVICIGDSVTLTATGATYYQWNTGSTEQKITVKPTKTSSYTVIGKTAGYDSAPTTALVTVSAFPIVNLGKDTLLAVGKSIVLNAGNNQQSYLWSNGATTPTILVKSAGTYAVTVTNTAGCKSYDTIVVSMLSSSIDLTDSGSISVLPNPVTDFLQVKSKVAISNMMLIDVQGKVKLNVALTTENEYEPVLNIAHLPSGMYFLRVMGRNFEKTLKIVKL